MTHFSSSRLALISFAFAAPFSLLAACSSESSPGGGGSGVGNAGAGNTPATGGSGGPGGGGVPAGGTGGLANGGSVSPGAGIGGSISAGSGGVSGAATAGTGGAAPVPMKDCGTKIVPTTPTLTNFETYTAAMSPYDQGTGMPVWNFSTGAMPYVAGQTGFAGLYALSEVSTEPYLLRFGPGADASTWALVASNTATTSWGGGVGFWINCLNASAFSGLTFSMRGSTPNMMVKLDIATEDTTPPGGDPATGGTCDPPPATLDGCVAPTVTVPISAEWTTILLPWAMFSPGFGANGLTATLNGDKITGMSFRAGIIYSEVEDPPGSGVYPAIPGSYEIAIDNLGFIPAAAPAP